MKVLIPVLCFLSVLLFGSSSSGGWTPLDLKAFQDHIRRQVQEAAKGKVFPSISSSTNDGVPAQNAINNIVRIYEIFIFKKQQIEEIKTSKSGISTWYNEKLTPALMNGWFLASLMRFIVDSPRKHDRVPDVGSMFSFFEYTNAKKNEMPLFLNAKIDALRYFMGLKLHEVFNLQYLLLEEQKFLLTHSAQEWEKERERIEKLKAEEKKRQEDERTQRCSESLMRKALIEREKDNDLELQAYIKEEAGNGRSLKEATVEQILDRIYYRTPHQSILAFREGEEPANAEDIRGTLMVLLSSNENCRHVLELDRLLLNTFGDPFSLQAKPIDPKSNPDCYVGLDEDWRICHFFAECLKAIATDEPLKIGKAKYENVFRKDADSIVFIKEQILKNLTSWVQQRFTVIDNPTIFGQERKTQLGGWYEKNAQFKLSKVVGDVNLAEYQIFDENLQQPKTCIFNNPQFFAYLVCKPLSIKEELSSLNEIIDKDNEAFWAKVNLTDVSDKGFLKCEWDKGVQTAKKNNFQHVRDLFDFHIARDTYNNLKRGQKEASAIGSQKVFTDQPITYFLKSVYFLMEDSQAVYFVDEKDLSGQKWWFYFNGGVKAVPRLEVEKLLTQKDKVAYCIYERSDVCIENRWNHLTQLFKQNAPPLSENHRGATCYAWSSLRVIWAMPEVVAKVLCVLELARTYGPKALKEKIELIDEATRESEKLPKEQQEEKVQELLDNTRAETRKNSIGKVGGLQLFMGLCFSEFLKDLFIQSLGDRKTGQSKTSTARRPWLLASFFFNESEFLIGRLATQQDASNFIMNFFSNFNDLPALIENESGFCLPVSMRTLGERATWFEAKAIPDVYAALEQAGIEGMSEALKGIHLYEKTSVELAVVRPVRVESRQLLLQYYQSQSFSVSPADKASYIQEFAQYIKKKDFSIFEQKLKDERDIGKNHKFNLITKEALPYKYMIYQLHRYWNNQKLLDFFELPFLIDADTIMSPLLSSKPRSNFIPKGKAFGDAPFFNDFYRNRLQKLAPPKGYMLKAVMVHAGASLSAGHWYMYYVIRRDGKVMGIMQLSDDKRAFCDRKNLRPVNAPIDPAPKGKPAPLPRAQKGQTSTGTASTTQGNLSYIVENVVGGLTVEGKDLNIPEKELQNQHTAMVLCYERIDSPQEYADAKDFATEWDKEIARVKKLQRQK